MASAPSPDTFAALGLRAEIVEALTVLGYEEPTPIQAATIPTLIEGRDLIGQAATGTGKTAAFALPALELLAAERDGTPRPPGQPDLLVLVPTRELAMQVSEAIHRYGRALDVRVVPLYGGSPMGRQLQALQRPVDVVVATPGRCLDHLRRGSLDLDGLQEVVLDEADEMLDMGFAEDLDAILDATPDDRQTVLFSATLPPRIVHIAREHLTDPAQIRLTEEATPEGETARVRETAYVVRRSHKAAALGRILDLEDPTAAIVFCRTRVEVDELTETLNGRGYAAQALHGGMSQEQRDRVMARVRSGSAELLIATDVAARGLDIDVLTHVVNYDVPSAPASYVHRIGRVGRAGREGTAITLVDPREHRTLKNIERVTRRRMEVAQVPSIDDLRSHRLEQTLAAVRDALSDEEDIERFRIVVETLAEDFDAVQIALGALKVAHEASGANLDEEREIPPARLPRDRPERSERPDRFNRGDRNDRSERGYDHDRGRSFDGDRDRGRSFDRDGGRDGRGGNHDRGGHDRRPSHEMTRLYVAAGRDQGVRPQDLVGAFAGETSLTGRDIGAIRIQGNFSLVEVPTEAVNEVLDAMRQSTIKGKKTVVRRERFENR